MNGLECGLRMLLSSSSSASQAAAEQEGWDLVLLSWELPGACALCCSLERFMEHDVLRVLQH